MDPQNDSSPSEIPYSNPLFEFIKKQVNTFTTYTPRWVLYLLLFTFVFGFFAFAAQKKESQYTAFIKSEPDYLAVVSAEPKGENKSKDSKVKIKFNLPVDAHHASEFFYMAPMVKGNLVQGNSEYEVIYQPDESYDPGSYVTVELKEGLTSVSGKKLLAPYRFYFSIDRDANTIQFTNNEWIGKFMSFTTKKGADITVKVGNDIKNPKVQVYKADAEALVKSIVYDPPKDNEGNVVSYGDGTYKETVVDTSKFAKVSEYTITNDEESIHFKEKTGLYLLQGLDGENVVNNVWIALNETGIHLRQDDKKVVLAAQNHETGDPEGDIDLTFYQLEGTPTSFVRHTLSGIQEYPLAFDQRLDLIVAKKGEDTMVIPVRVPNSQADILVTDNLDRAHEVFIYTDRPVYKKGAKVSFRGLVRKDNDGVYQQPSVRTVKISASISKDWEFEKEVPLSANGVFYGEYTLPNDIPDDPESIYDNSFSVSAQVSVGGKSYGDYANYEIFEYTKPSYELEVVVDQSEYIKSDTVKATLKGKLFTGQPLANQEVTYTIYAKDYYETEKAVYNSAFNLNSWGGMCGAGFDFEDYYGVTIKKAEVIKLNQNGEAIVEFNTKELKSLLSQEITLLIEKKDQNGNRIVGARRAIVHQGRFNVFFRPGPTRIAFNDEFSVKFYAEDLQGKKLENQNFTYAVYEETWNENQESNRKVIKTGNAKTNSDGEAQFTEKIEQLENRYLYLLVSTVDEKGNTIEAKKGLTMFTKGDPNAIRDTWWDSSLAQTVLKITSDKGSLTTSDISRLEIVAPEEMSVFLAFERGRVYDPRWVHLTKGINTLEFDVPENYAPSITPTFSFFYNGKYYIEGLSLNVPAMHKLLDVSISTDKERYTPGDTAIITITTRDNRGNLVSADVGIGIVDKAIYALRKDATPPLHSSFYFYRRRSTNSSSSLSWIATFNWGGGGGGGGGSENLLKDSDTLYWNPTLQTGSDGQVKVEVPVGQTQTTWQAIVYASTDDTKVGQSTEDFLVVR